MTELYNETDQLRALSHSLQQKIASLEAALREKETVTAALRQNEAREAHIKQVLLAIRNVNQLIVHETNPLRLIEQACLNLTETLGYFNAWIALLDEPGQAIKFTASAGFNGTFQAMARRLKQGNLPGVTRRALECDQTLVVTTPQNDCPDCPLSDQYGDRAGFSRRLNFDGKVYGILAVSVPAQYAHDAEEQALFNEVAGDLAFALHRIEAEEQLKVIQEEQKYLLQSMINAFVIFESVFDEQGRFISYRFNYINAAYERITGVTLEQVRGKTVFEVWPETEPAWIETYGAVAVSGASQTFEMFHKPTDKLYHCTVYRPWATPDRFCVIFDDITERKQVEAELRTSQQITEGIINTIPVRVFWKDKNLVYLGCNAAFARDAGFSTPQDIIGKDDYQMGWRDQAELYRNDDREVIENGHSKILIEEPQTTPAGDTITLLTSKIPLRNSEGEISGVLGVYMDITERKHAEEAFRRNQAMLARTERIAHVGSWEWEIATDTVTWSEELFRIFGRNPSDGAPSYAEHYKLYPPQDMARLAKAVETALNTGTPYELELSAIRADGVVRACLALGYPEVGPDGAITRLFGSLQDITERKQAEVALQTNEENLWSLFNAIHESVFLFDRNEIILTANKTFAERLGLSIADCVGQSIYSLIPPDVAEKRKAFVAQVMQSRQPVIFEDERLGRWLHHSMNPILDTNGEVDRVAVYAFDITERKRTEEALRASENRFRAYFDLLPAYCYMVSPEGAILDLNRSALNFLGYRNKAEVVGKPLLTTVYAPHNQAKAREMFLRWRQTGRLDKEELTIVSKNGEERLVWLEAGALRDDNGQVLHSISIQVDITERKQAEVEREKLQAQLLQAQKMESVGRLAGGVAHDFNNMLLVILGHAELALNRIDPAHPIYADLEEIHKAARRSAELTRQLLAFARKQTIIPQRLDLNDTLASMLKLLQRLIGEDINLVWKPGANLWPVMMDPTQIDQILANLAVNARDAIAGVGSLAIETKNVTLDAAYCVINADSVPGDYVRLTVSDTGLGMEKKTLEHLFEPFFTTKEVGKGTGLGLATIYGIVRQNNGFINVYSEPGQGTTFSIYLPRHAGNEPQIPDETAASAPSGGPETILLVEDELVILDMTRQMLEEFGYQVLTANAPGDAIRLASDYTGEIHLLMTDVVMPGINGRDLAKQLLSFYPALKCLFMSGYTADVIAHRGVLDEGVYFVQKPFSMKELATKVRQVLD